jgi:transcriptional regulator with XRE-family HTH domain
MTASARLTSLAPAVRSKSTPRKLRSLGKAIVALRNKRGLGREDFAAKIGLSYSNTANIETGQNWPSMPVYIRICEVLGISVPLIR